MQGPQLYLDARHECRCWNEAETDGKVKEILMNVKGTPQEKVSRQ